MSDSNEKNRSLGELLKHPLANVVIGFLLTGVLGTTLTQYYMVKRQKYHLVLGEVCTPPD